MKHDEYVTANLTNEEIAESIPATEQNYENIIKLFDRKLTAKKAQSPQDFTVTIVSPLKYLLAAIACCLLIAGFAFALPLLSAEPPVDVAVSNPPSTTQSEDAPAATTEAPESPAEPPNTSVHRILCPRTGEIVNVIEAYADEQPGMFKSLAEIGESFMVRVNELEMTGYDVVLHGDGVEMYFSTQNGEVVWFTIDRFNHDGWKLSKGDKLTLSFTIDLSADYSAQEGELAEIGVFNRENHTFTDLYTGRIKDTLTVEFVAPQDGVYNFYHINSGTAPQNYTRIEIAVPQEYIN
jgi:hypothetical protein